MSDRGRPDLTAIVPVYRNRDTVAAVAAQIFELARGLGIRCEIVFVNDASPDGSLAVLSALAAAHPASVVVVDLPTNVGQHAAVLHGLARATGTTCAILDADLQDRPSSIATLWQARAPGVGVVFGGRTGRYESPGRHVTSQVFKGALHVLAGVPRDAGIFMLLEREVVEALVCFPTRVPCIQAMVGLLGVQVTSVPVAREHRRTGSSSYSRRRRLGAGMRGVWCAIEYRVWRPSRPYLPAHADPPTFGTETPKRHANS